MRKPTRVSSPVYTFFPTEVEGFDSLAELARSIVQAFGLDLHPSVPAFAQAPVLFGI